MKIQNYLMPIALSALTILGLQYFFGGLVKQENHDAQFVVVEQEVPQTPLPLKKEIQFENKNKDFIPERTIITTEWGAIGFSSEGATIEYIDYKKFGNRMLDSVVRTIFPTTSKSAHIPAFLLAFSENTPTEYTLVRQELLEKKAILTYENKNDNAIITKQFIIFYDTYAIDLNIAINPVSQKSLEFVRLFFPAPHFESTDFNDSTITTGLVIVDKYNKIEKSKDTLFIKDRGWFGPKYIGLENQHFVNMLYKDFHNAVSRVYYTGDNFISDAIVEMKPISAKTNMSFSFYLGPKDTETIADVDQKMAEFFGYKGVLAPLYAFLFKLLKFFYEFCGNFGIAIILLSLAIHLLLLPLSISGHRNQKEQKEFDKKMNYLAQKYKNDPDRLAIERAELLKSQGAMLTSALLQFVINIPLFVCINYLLGSSVALFNAPFLWINDLSGYDPLYILPICVGTSFLFRLSSNTDAKKQLNMALFALVIGALATRFSAGFGIYFVINTVLSIVQTYVLDYLGKKKII